MDDAPNYYAVIPARVLYDEELRPNAKLLYGVISSLCNATGYCWAENRTLAEKFGLKPDTVSGLIGNLEKRGHVFVDVIRSPETNEVTGRRVWVDTYYLSGEFKPPVLPDTPPRKISDTPPLEKSDTSPKNIGDYNVNNKYYNNTPISPKGKKGKRTSAEVVNLLSEYAGQNNPELLASLYDFADLREKLGSPLLTKRQVSILINKLENLSGGNGAVKVALLQEAVLRNWLSVYPLSDEKLRQLPRGSQIIEEEETSEWK